MMTIDELLARVRAGQSLAGMSFAGVDWRGLDLSGARLAGAPAQVTPGGTAANLFSHLYGGDVALNVTLTAVNSVISVVTLPLVRHDGGDLDWFSVDADKPIPAPAALVDKVTIIPDRVRYPGAPLPRWWQ